MQPIAEIPELVYVERVLGEAAQEKMRQANQNNIDKRYGFQIFENRIIEPLHAAEQAAQIIGTNRQYVSDAKRVQERA